MAATLEPGKSLKRLIKVYGIEGMVEVTISHEGVSFRIPGTQKRLVGTWTDAVKATSTPNDVPSHLFGEPFKFLEHEALKVKARKEKKASK